jgi:hypothetical protein
MKNQPVFKSEMISINPAATPCKLHLTCPDYEPTRHHCTDFHNGCQRRVIAEKKD